MESDHESGKVDGGNDGLSFFFSAANTSQRKPWKQSTVRQEVTKKTALVRELDCATGPRESPRNLHHDTRLTPILAAVMRPVHLQSLSEYLPSYLSSTSTPPMPMASTSGSIGMQAAVRTDDSGDGSACSATNNLHVGDQNQSHVSGEE